MKRFYFFISLIFVSGLFSSPLADSLVRHPQNLSNKTLTIEMVGKNGGWLQLSDDKKYFIAQEDRDISGGWFSTIKVKVVSNNNDRKYPYSIVNVNTGSKVRAREVSKLAD